MNFRHLLLVVVVGVLLSSTVLVSAQETTDGSFAVTFLENGVTLEDTFDAEVGARLYGFNASAGDVITLTMTQVTEELDPYLVLLGPRGELIAVDDDSGEAALFAAALTDVTLPASGGYFVLATTFANIDTIIATDTATTSTYTITLNGITEPTDIPDFNPDGLSYFRGDLEFGATVEGVSSLEEPVFYYAFNGTAGQVVDITMASDDIDTILHVFDPMGNRIAVNDDDGVSTNSAIEDLTLPVDGQYLVFATDLFFYFLADPDLSTDFAGGTFTITLAEN